MFLLPIAIVFVTIPSLLLSHLYQGKCIVSLFRLAARQARSASVSTMQIYVKENALCYGEFVNKRFLLFKKKLRVLLVL
jgi:hypothetical protein